MTADTRAAIARFVAQAAGAQAVHITEARLLSGGAVQENWAVDLQLAGGPWAGELQAVLRCDSPTAGVSVSHGRAQEFALLRTVHQAGVTVPEPLWLCDDPAVMGRPFFLMRRIAGTAAAHQLVKDATLGGDRVQLAERLGLELARIHSVRPPHSALDFLETATDSPALRRVREHRAFLDQHHTAYPALEWGLRWLERHAPPQGLLTLCHGDFRTGNYMVDAQGLTGVLDWEFARWSDPLEDLGWFCARCWRFGQVAQEAGGIGAREDFYRGYEQAAGRLIDRAAVRYWEVMAHTTWAVIAVQQAERHCSGQENSLLLALTGHIVPELEWDILNMTQDD